MKYFKPIIIHIICLLLVTITYGQTKADAIVGKWISDKGECIVDVYKDNNEYKAKAIWFNVKTHPMEYWKDDKNPDPALRSRKLLGMDVVNKLHYDPKSNEWIDGIIYDATTGKSWDSVVWLTKDNTLKVKGYWLFKFLSKTMTFKSYKN